MDEKVEKVIFGELCLEITRRCQLKCAHCMRGDAQDIDMPEEIIDSILDQCAGIFSVFFTGGEPTMNIEGMDYFLREVQRRNIPLGQLSFVTNGVSIPESMKDFLERAYDYITESRMNCEAFRTDATIARHPRILIGISADSYHCMTSPTQAKTTYEGFLPYDGCHVYLHKVNYTANSGRAAELNGTITYPISKYQKQQIGIVHDGKNLICEDCIHINDILRFCDAYIPCSIGITAKGKVFPRQILDVEYDTEDNVLFCVCEYSDGRIPSIIKSVLEYNEGKLPCFIVNNMNFQIKKSELHALLLAEKNRYVRNVGFNYFDPIYYSEHTAISIEEQKSKYTYLKAYKLHLANNIPFYTNRDVFRRDFPSSNEYFYQKVLEKIEDGFNVNHITNFIMEHKNDIWFNVDEIDIDEAKRIFVEFNAKIVYEAEKERGHVLSYREQEKVKKYFKCMPFAFENTEEYLAKRSKKKENIKTE